MYMYHNPNYSCIQEVEMLQQNVVFTFFFKDIKIQTNNIIMKKSTKYFRFYLSKDVLTK